MVVKIFGYKLYNKLFGEIRETVADANGTDQVTVLGILEQEVQDALPQQEEGEWPSLVFRYDKGSSQFKGL